MRTEYKSSKENDHLLGLIDGIRGTKVDMMMATKRHFCQKKTSNSITQTSIKTSTV